MNIAILTNGITPQVVGGMQRHSFYLVKYLAARGVSIHLFHTNLYGPLLDEEAYLEGFDESERQNITSWFVPFPEAPPVPGKYLISSHRLSRAYSKILATLAGDLDFIYAKNYCAWDWLAHHHQPGKTPPVGTKLHGYEYYQKGLTMRYAYVIPFYRLAARKNTLPADYVFSYGGKITSIIRDRIGVAPEKIIEIPTGIAEDWLNNSVGAPGDTIRLAFLGRYSRRKGTREIFQALQTLPSDVRWKFDFIGPIPDQARWEDPRIQYHGEVRQTEQIRAILREADILMAPSFSEGMPNVIMEGMASGCAIIATDVGAVAAQVSSDNGWLLPAPSAQGIREAILDASSMNSQALLAKKKASVKQVRDHFTWSQVADQTLSAIQKIIQ